MINNSYEIGFSLSGSRSKNTKSLKEDFQSFYFRTSACYTTTLLIMLIFWVSMKDGGKLDYF